VILAFCFFDPLLRELNRSRVFVGAGNFRDGFRLLHRFDLAPRIRGRISAAVPATGERQKELVRLSTFGIAPAAAFRDFNEAECLRFPNRRRNQARRDAVFHEIQLVTGKRPLSLPPWLLNSISIREMTRWADRLSVRYAGDFSISIVRGEKASLIRLRRLMKPGSALVLRSDLTMRPWDVRPPADEQCVRRDLEAVPQQASSPASSPRRPTTTVMTPPPLSRRCRPYYRCGARARQPEHIVGRHCREGEW
jgi:hypothetical protein